MNRQFASPAQRQRGAVTIVAMVFLILIVVFSLGQMLNVSAGGVIDGQRQADSKAAFFLAESGVDKVHSAVAVALGGSFDNSTCTGMPATVGSPYALGRGNVTVSAVSSPATCDNSGVTPCATCTVTSTGRVNGSTRTVTDEIALTSSNGVFCNAAGGSCSNSPTPTWQLKLRNGSGVGGIGIFVLSFEQQGNNSATCALASNCRLQLQVASPSNGNNSVGLQGNAVQIPAGTTYPIYQVLSATNRSAVEVGGFFLGTSTPTLTGPTTSPGAASYWDDNKNNASTKTVGTNGSNTGGTNDGTAVSGGSCAAPGATAQTCTSWCYGADTLAFSFSANVTTVNDTLTSVTFGTNSGVGQNIAMTQIAKYPSALIPGAPPGIDAEIWYASNPNLTGAAPLATGASSWKGRGTAAVGAQWTSNSTDTTAIANPGGVPTLTVGNSFTGYPSRIISVGDAVANSGGGGSPTCTTNCGTIVQQLTSAETGGALGGRGTYRLSAAQTVNAANNRQWTISSNVLNVTACSTCFLASGDAVALTGLSAGRTINAAQSTPATTYGRTEVAGGLGRYPISGAATQVASSAALFVGTPGTTLYLPAAQPQPAVTTPAMLLTVKSGTGAMVPGTRVQSIATANAATSSFTVNTAPSTALDNATICAGACAFFVPGTTTSYALGNVAGNANFNYWTAGFTCMRGVDLVPQPVKSTSSIRGRWTEPVQ